MSHFWQISLAGITISLAACSSMAPSTSRPAGWSAPQVLVAPSSFTGVHGLAVDSQGRLLAGTVVGDSVRRTTAEVNVEVVMKTPLFARRPARAP